MDKLADLQESSDERQAELRNETPDFLVKAKEYIKKNPAALREIAGDEIQKLEAYLDTLPLGLGDIGKAKLNEFLGSGNGQNARDGVKDAPGREIEGELEEDRDTIPKERWNEILAEMVSMDDEGITPGRISDIIADDYGVELSHTQIWQYIERYRRSLKAQEEIEEKEHNEEEKIVLRRLEIQKVQNERWKRLNDELNTLRRINIELDKKQAVHEALREKGNPGRNEKVGLIRWLVRKLY